MNKKKFYVSHEGLCQLTENRINAKIVIWNLKMVEKNLHKENKADDAFTIRLALNLLSSNWRIAKSIEDIIVK